MDAAGKSWEQRPVMEPLMNHTGTLAMEQRPVMEPLMNHTGTLEMEKRPAMEPVVNHTGTLEKLSTNDLSLDCSVSLNDECQMVYELHA